MYGGLFGDLPETKNSKKPEGDTKKNEETGHEVVSTTSKLPAAPQAPTSATKQSTRALSMAFIPAAARARKRNKATPINHTVIKKNPPSVAGAKQIETTPAAPSTISSTFAVSTHIELPPVVDKGRPNNSIVFSVHEPSSDSTTKDNDQSTKSGGKELIQQDFVEPEELRKLHEEAKSDPYDPLFPNDLLQYWERKSFEKDRIRLEQERQQALEDQERLREQLKKEREELARSGNLQELQQREQRRPMGRGRGVSNIPAWLIEKQKHDAGGS